MSSRSLNLQAANSGPASDELPNRLNFVEPDPNPTAANMPLRLLLFFFTSTQWWCAVPEHLRLLLTHEDAKTLPMHLFEAFFLAQALVRIVLNADVGCGTALFISTSARDVKGSRWILGGVKKPC